MNSDCAFCDAIIDELNRIKRAFERAQKELAILRGSVRTDRMSVLYCVVCRGRIVDGVCSCHGGKMGARMPYDRDPELMEYRDYVLVGRRSFKDEPRNIIDKATILFDEGEAIV